MSFILSHSKIKIKREDLDIFNLDVNNLKNNRVIINNRFIIFTNVYSFEQQVLSLIKVKPDQQT
jgi:hypothetical protein